MPLPAVPGRNWALSGFPVQRAAPAVNAPAPLLQPWYSKKNISIGCDRPFDDLLCSAQLPEAMVKGFAFLVPYYQYFFSFCGGGLEDLR